MKGIKIMVNKDSMDALSECINNNVELISTALTMRFHNEEYSLYIEEKLKDIQYYMERAYSPTLVEMKRKSQVFYQKWLLLKKTDKSTANAIYIEYLNLKYRIDLMEIPF